MNLQQIRIGTRLGLGFGLLLLLLMGAIAVAISLSTHQRQATSLALGVATAKERLTGEMRAALLESAVAMRNVALESDVGRLQEQADKARADRKRYAEAQQAFEALGVSADERKGLADAAALDKAVEQPFFQAVALAQAFNGEDAVKVVSTQVDPLQQKQIAVINGLQALQLSAGRQVAEQAEAAASRLNLMLVVMGLFAVVMGSTLAWVFTRSITRPLTAAVQVAEGVAAGDLGATIVVEGKDEAAKLLESMRRMTLQLQHLVSGVRDTAQDVTRTARDISSGHADLSARTEAQASSLEQTAASVEQLTATVSKTAENAHSAHDLARGATKIATEGQAVVGRVVETMESIHRSSGRIAEINAVIDGIAFQTNILALNAAVEAARAGEQGRGFAVVATEVRQLSQRSAQAAKEIRQLIEESVEQTAAGSKLVAEAGVTMGQVVGSIDQVRTLVGEISQSSREQSVGIAQVNEAIAHIDSATQQNAGFVESAASSASQLQQQADELVAAVSVFKIGALATSDVAALT